MKVLMISIDKGLLGRGQLGDVIERHRAYGQKVQRLDIIVLSPKGFSPYQISDNVWSYPTNSSNKIKYYFDAKKIGKKLFEKTTYDLIVTQEPFFTGLAGAWLKKKFGAKFLVHFHGDFWQNINWLKENKLNWMLWLISKLVVVQADAIRVMSNGQKNTLIKAGVSPDKVNVIATPVDLKKYDRLDLVPTSDFKTVLHVGRDDKVKGYDTLLKAFDLIKRQMPDVKLVKVLGGKEFSKALNNHSNKDLKISVYPQTNHQDLVAFYCQADVVVLSSTSESFGKVLVEANACGKPVVSTNTTGGREIIRDGYNGFLVPIGDYQALADKVLFLLNHSDQAKAMGQNGKNLVRERFSDNLDQIIELWRKIIGTKI
ncbi:MAG: glycosyltransferase family 4 protein [Candidatus Buchananbacteria bacterium]